MLYYLLLCCIVLYCTVLYYTITAIMYFRPPFGVKWGKLKGVAGKPFETVVWHCQTKAIAISGDKKLPEKSRVTADRTPGKTLSSYLLTE